MKRPICLHMHIFKNAGTTIDWILKKNFSKNAIRMDVETPRAILPMKIVSEFLCSNPNVKSFSSHQLRFPIPEDGEFQLFPIVFLRHPLDRIFSIYNFNKRRSDVRSKSVAKVKKSDVAEYFKWYLKSKHQIVMKNFQVVFLTKSDNSLPATNDDLTLAFDRIKNIEIFGVTDRFDESLVVAEERLKQIFQNIDLSYVRKNVSADRPTSLADRINHAREQIGDSLMAELEENNDLDIKLYEFAKEELDNRMRKIENFEEKLHDFKKRCSSLKNRILNFTLEFRSRRMWYSPENNMIYYKNKKMS